MILNVATCQILTGFDIQQNLTQVLDQIKAAKAQDADVAHFPEACLSGYAGIDLDSFVDFDWAQLQNATEQVMALARELNIWVVLGSSHRLSGDHKPHNSLYIINNVGKIHDRYDKLFCAGDESGEVGDLAHYSPGNHFCVFDIKGVRCGTLICHDYRYPELYREYQQLGVQLMFHSFHAGNIKPDFYQFMQQQVGFDKFEINPANTIPGITQPAAMIASASNNYMWISCPNSGTRSSCWGSFVVRPDGIIADKLPRHKAGVLLTVMDTEAEFYDSTVAWRDRAIKGVYHSGELVQDARSDDRTAL